MIILLLFLLAGSAFAQTAKYPDAIATYQDVLKAKDRSTSTLTGDIGADTMALPVADGTRFVAYQTVTIADEQILVCSVAGNSLNVCTGGRGFAGTTPASHTTGDAVRGQFTGWHHNALAAELMAIETALGINLANVALAVHQHAATDLTSGTLPDDRVAASNVTQHQATLVLSAGQTTSGEFDAARIPNLDASKITAGTLGDGRIAASNVTQHQAALTIAASQIPAEDKAGSEAKLVTAAAKGTTGNCAQWTATGVGDAGAACGVGGGGEGANDFAPSVGSSTLTVAAGKGRIGNTTYAIGTGGVVFSGGSGDCKTFVSEAGVLTTYCATGISGTQTGTMVLANVTTPAYPAGAIPIADLTIASGVPAIDSDDRSFISTKALQPGLGILIPEVAGVGNPQIDPTVVPTLAGANAFTGETDFSAATKFVVRRGAGVPPSATCNEAGEVGNFYVRTDAESTGISWYGCSKTGPDTYAWELLQAEGGGAPPNMVTTDTEQTITGQKTFTAPITNFDGDVLLQPGRKLGVGTTTPDVELHVAGEVKITGGSPDAGKVLTSDAVGLASWQTPSGDAVTSVFGRTGDVVAQDGDYSAVSETLTNKTLNVEGTGNNITTVHYNTWLAANCQGTAAALGFATPANGTPTAACVTGSNTNYGVAQFADAAAASVQGRFPLPPDWTGAIDLDIRWRSNTTTASVVWQLQTVCVADGETGDPAWNAAQTVTDASKGTAWQFNDAQIATVTTTGCAAGEEMFFKFLRDPAHASDDLGATAELLWIRFKLRRAQ